MPEAVVTSKRRRGHSLVDLPSDLIASILSWLSPHEVITHTQSAHSKLRLVCSSDRYDAVLWRSYCVESGFTSLVFRTARMVALLGVGADAVKGDYEAAEEEESRRLLELRLGRGGGGGGVGTAIAEATTYTAAADEDDGDDAPPIDHSVRFGTPDGGSSDDADEDEEVRNGLGFVDEEDEEEEGFASSDSGMPNDEGDDDHDVLESDLRPSHPTPHTVLGNGVVDRSDVVAALAVYPLLDLLLLDVNAEADDDAEEADGDGAEDEEEESAQQQTAAAGASPSQTQSAAAVAAEVLAGATKAAVNGGGIAGASLFAALPSTAANVLALVADKLVMREYVLRAKQFVEEGLLPLVARACAASSSSSSSLGEVRRARFDGDEAQQHSISPQFLRSLPTVYPHLFLTSGRPSSSPSASAPPLPASAAIAARRPITSYRRAYYAVRRWFVLAGLGELVDYPLHTSCAPAVVPLSPALAVNSSGPPSSSAAATAAEFSRHLRAMPYPHGMHPLWARRYVEDVLLPMDKRTINADGPEGSSEGSPSPPTSLDDLYRRAQLALVPNTHRSVWAAVEQSWRCIEDYALLEAHGGIYSSMLHGALFRPLGVVGLMGASAVDVEAEEEEAGVQERSSGAGGHRPLFASSSAAATEGPSANLRYGSPFDWLCAEVIPPTMRGPRRVAAAAGVNGAAGIDDATSFYTLSPQPPPASNLVGPIRMPLDVKALYVSTGGQDTMGPRYVRLATRMADTKERVSNAMAELLLAAPRSADDEKNSSTIIPASSSLGARHGDTRFAQLWAALSPPCPSSSSSSSASSSPQLKWVPPPPIFALLGTAGGGGGVPVATAASMSRPLCIASATPSACRARNVFARALLSRVAAVQHKLQRKRRAAGTVAGGVNQVEAFRVCPRIVFGTSMRVDADAAASGGSAPLAPPTASDAVLNTASLPIPSATLAFYDVSESDAARGRMVAPGSLPPPSTGAPLPIPFLVSGVFGSVLHYDVAQSSSLVPFDFIAPSIERDACMGRVRRTPCAELRRVERAAESEVNQIMTDHPEGNHRRSLIATQRADNNDAAAPHPPQPSSEELRNARRTVNTQDRRWPRGAFPFPPLSPAGANIPTVATRSDLWTSDEDEDDQHYHYDFNDQQPTSRKVEAAAKRSRAAPIVLEDEKPRPNYRDPLDNVSGSDDDVGEAEEDAPEWGSVASGEADADEADTTTPPGDDYDSDTDSQGRYRRAYHAYHDRGPAVPNQCVFPSGRHGVGEPIYIKSTFRWTVPFIAGRNYLSVNPTTGELVSCLPSGGVLAPNVSTFLANYALDLCERRRFIPDQHAGFISLFATFGVDYAANTSNSGSSSPPRGEGDDLSGVGPSSSFMRCHNVSTTVTHGVEITMSPVMISVRPNDRRYSLQQQRPSAAGQWGPHRVPMQARGLGGEGSGPIGVPPVDDVATLPSPTSMRGRGGGRGAAPAASGGGVSVAFAYEATLRLLPSSPCAEVQLLGRMWRIRSTVAGDATSGREQQQRQGRVAAGASSGTTASHGNAHSRHFWQNLCFGEEGRHAPSHPLLTHFRPQYNNAAFIGPAETMRGEGVIGQYPHLHRLTQEEAAGTRFGGGNAPGAATFNSQIPIFYHYIPEYAENEAAHTLMGVGDSDEEDDAGEEESAQRSRGAIVGHDRTFRYVSRTSYETGAGLMGGSFSFVVGSLSDPQQPPSSSARATAGDETDAAPLPPPAAHRFVMTRRDGTRVVLEPFEALIDDFVCRTTTDNAFMYGEIG